MGPIRKRLVIDMDETIADSLSRQLDWFERDAVATIQPRELEGADLKEFLGGEHAQLLRSYAHHEDFFRDLPLLDGAQEALEKLSETYDIYIATAAMEFPLSFAPKYE